MSIYRSSEDVKAMDVEIVTTLKKMIDNHNLLAKTFRSARDRYNDGQVQEVGIRLIRKRERDGRTNNLPTASEVAALVVGDIDASTIDRDIIVETKSRSLQRIDVLHPSYLGL